MKLTSFCSLSNQCAKYAFKPLFFMFPLSQEFGVYRTGFNAPVQLSHTGTCSSTAEKEHIVKFPRKNLLNVLAAHDENEHHVSKEGTGWGDSVNAALCVCMAAHS